MIVLGKEDKKIKTRRFIFKANEAVTKFKLIKIFGPLPFSPRIGDYQDMAQISIIVSNGNDVYIKPDVPGCTYE